MSNRLSGFVTHQVMSTKGAASVAGYGLPTFITKQGGGATSLAVTPGAVAVAGAGGQLYDSGVPRNITHYYNNPNSPGIVTPAITRLDQMDISKAGVIGGVIPATRQYAAKIELDAMKLGMAEALKRGIASTPDSLAVRPIIPNIDFEDQNSNPVGNAQWRQPWSGGYVSVSGSQFIYQTNQDIQYDRKIFVLYGLETTNTGPGRTGPISNATNLQIKDSAQNVYDIWECSRLDVHTELYCYSPIVFNNARALRIDLTPRIDSSGTFDTISILGKVVEPLGDTIMGNRRSLLY